MRRTKSLSKLLVVVTAMLLQSCAGQSIFSPYPMQADSMRNSLLDEKSSQDDLIQDLENNLDSKDALLYALELGRLRQTREEYQESKLAFEQAIAVFEEQDLQATLRASNVAATGISFLTNDNAIPYTGAGYERIAAHHFQAMNYWALGDYSGAGVEFRKVALEQDFLTQKHEKELKAAEQELDDQNVNVSFVEEQLPAFDPALIDIKSSFLNAYTYYSSGVFREFLGELNDARVDYIKALELHPNSALLKQSLRRVRAKQGELSRSEREQVLAKDMGELVILFEQGLVPAQQEFSISVPSFTGKVLSIAFPYYSDENWPSIQSLEVSVPGLDEPVSTEPLVNFGSLAVKHAQEQMSAKLARQVARTWSKYELQRQSGESLGLLGQFAANIYTIVSERADLRSWLTLPYSGQAQSLSLSKGSHTVLLQSGASSRKVDIQIKASRPTVLYVLNVGSRLRVIELPM